MVPLLFLCLTDHWLRMPRWIRVPVGVAVVLHSWVLTVFRAPADQAWRLFFAEGPQLPWFRVLRQTSSPDIWWLNRWWIPAALLGVVIVAVAGIWQYGASQAARRPVPGALRPVVRR